MEVKIGVKTLILSIINPVSVRQPRASHLFNHTELLVEMRRRLKTIKAFISSSRT